MPLKAASLNFPKLGKFQLSAVPGKGKNRPAVARNVENL